MESETTPSPARTYPVGTWQHYAQTAIAELQQALLMDSTWGECSDYTKRPLTHARTYASSAVRELGSKRKSRREFERRRKREEIAARHEAAERESRARAELARRGVEVPIDRLGYFSPSQILERILREERKNTGTEG